MKTMLKYPINFDSEGDRVKITYSDGTVEDQGRLSGFPGKEMSDVTVTESGMLQWTDPLDNVTSVGNIAKNLKMRYVSTKSGVYSGAGELSDLLNLLIEQNLVHPSDPDLVYTLTPDLGEQSRVGWTQFTIANVATITATSHQTSSYPLHSVYSTEGTLPFSFSSSDYVKEIVFEYVEPITISAIFQDHYRLTGRESSFMEFFSSVDGETWIPFHVNKRDDIGNVVSLEKPIRAKWFKLKANKDSGLAEVPPTHFLINKLDIVSGLNINDEWYDSKTARLIEHGDKFTLEPVFDKSRNAENFKAVDPRDSAILRGLTPAGTSMDIAYDRLITMDTIVGSPEPVTYRNGAFLLPKGHYEITARLGVLTSNRHVVLDAYNCKGMVKIASSSSEYKTYSAGKFTLGNYTLSFYNPSENWISFMQNYGASLPASVEEDLVEELRIFRLTDTESNIKVLSNISETNESIFETLSIEDVNIDIRAETITDGDTANLLTGNVKGSEDLTYALNKISNEPTILTFTFPSAVNIAGFSMDQPSTYNIYIHNFDVELLVNGEWENVYSHRVFKRSQSGAHYDARWPEVEATKARISITDNSSAGSVFYIGRINFFNGTRIRKHRIPVQLIDKVVATSGTSFTTEESLVRSEGSVTENFTEASPLKVRTDRTSNVYLKYINTGSNLGEYTLTIRDELTGEILPIELVHEVIDEWLPVTTNLPPGIYSIYSSHTGVIIRSLYFEEL